MSLTEAAERLEVDLCLIDEAEAVRAADDRIDRLRDQVDELTAVVEAVAAIHARDNERGPDAHGLWGCKGCDEGETWPCDTARALDGGPERTDR